MSTPRLSRRRLAGCALLALLTLAAGAWWFATPDRATRANYELIREGMSYTEVVSILGPPDGDGVDDDYLWDRWDAAVVVSFSRHRVGYKHFMPKDWGESCRHMWRRAVHRPAPF
jgi:hypothetical protein